jgi:SAM-dependent methyltransferase
MKLNSLAKNPAGIYMNPAFGGIDYSDGAAAEEYIMQSISNARDISSTSFELESLIRDWPSEYHLSASRANLLRPFNLGKSARILEFGCGCGAVTRHLGESGHKVDAIEGSLRRAEITASRCRDLAGVNVICANYSALEFPEAEYDLALFIGVLEYAKMFWGGASANTQEDALKAILAAARKTLKPNGVLIAAIENSLGLKYWIGCREDHTGLLYESLHGYANSPSVKTYSRRELRDALAASGFSCVGFFYPFPDYKLPSTILNDDFIREHRNADAAVHQTRSRDYVRNYSTDFVEPLVWHTLQQSGLLGEFANSFLVFASPQGDLARLYDFDMVAYSPVCRKGGLATETRKLKESDAVVKRFLLPENMRGLASPILEHRLRDSRWIDGRLLSEMLLKAACNRKDLAEFFALTAKYREFLSGVIRREQTPTANFGYDCALWNIIVKDSGEWESFDLEWGSRIPMTTEKAYFRNLVLWFSRHATYLAHFSAKHGLHTVGDALTAIFSKAGLSLTDETIDDFCRDCDELQFAVERERTSFKKALRRRFNPAATSMTDRRPTPARKPALLAAGGGAI